MHLKDAQKEQILVSFRNVLVLCQRMANQYSLQGQRRKYDYRVCTVPFRAEEAILKKCVKG